MRSLIINLTIQPLEDADGAELLAAALQDDSDVEDEDNSVTAI